jgi:RHS repeat-associated protein
VIALVISELETKPAPEAYMGYNLYDSNSNLYEQGKVILSKKARDKHEELIEKIAIKKDGYIETFLVNETSENVWFDQFRVMSTGPIIVQETHYDPWGLEIKELGYQYGGIKVNPYLYNGKEAIGHLGIELYDYGARMYDPVIGRWSVVDPMADQREWLSPYNYVQNNPMLRVDPDGMLDEYNFNVDTGEFDWISDKGGDERQYVNVVNNEGDLLGEGSVQGSEVYAYRLRESVVLTNFDAEFDDRSYNRENGYQYSSGDFQLRNEYRKTDNVFGRFIDKAEGAGKAVPISLREHEMKYGYLTSRLMMMGTAIESGLMLADPLGKPFSVGGSRYFSRTVGVSGSQGAKALTNANTGWNSFLKANTGKYSGAGWQRRAAADYYKSSSYKK